MAGGFTLADALLGIETVKRFQRTSRRRVFMGFTLADALLGIETTTRSALLTQLRNTVSLWLMPF